MIRERLPPPARVATRLIAGAGHMYVGQEEQVAALLHDWLDGLPLA